MGIAITQLLTPSTSKGLAGGSSSAGGDFFDALQNLFGENANALEVQVDAGLGKPQLSDGLAGKKIQAKGKGQLLDGGKKVGGDPKQPNLNPLAAMILQLPLVSPPAVQAVPNAIKEPLAEEQNSVSSISQGVATSGDPQPTSAKDSAGIDIQEILKQSVSNPLSGSAQIADPETVEIPDASGVTPIAAKAKLISLPLNADVSGMTQLPQITPDEIKTAISLPNMPAAMAPNKIPEKPEPQGVMPLGKTSVKTGEPLAKALSSLDTAGNEKTVAISPHLVGTASSDPKSDEKPANHANEKNGGDVQRQSTDFKTAPSSVEQAAVAVAPAAKQVTSIPSEVLTSNVISAQPHSVGTAVMTPVPASPTVSSSVATAGSGITSAPTVLNSAKLIDKVSETEMKVGLKIPEFGAVEIRTSVDDHQLQAHIQVEHSGLREAISSSLPDLQRSFAEQRLGYADVTVHQHQTGLGGSSSGADRQSSAGHYTHSPNVGNETAPIQVSNVTDDWTAEDPAVGLDLHV